MFKALRSAGGFLRPLRSLTRKKIIKCEWSGPRFHDAMCKPTSNCT